MQSKEILLIDIEAICLLNAVLNRKGNFKKIGLILPSLDFLKIQI